MIVQFSAIIKENANSNVNDLLNKFSEVEMIELIDADNNKTTYNLESLEVDEIAKVTGNYESLYGNETYTKRYIYTNQKKLNHGDLIVINNEEFAVLKSDGELYLHSLTSDQTYFKGWEIKDCVELYEKVSSIPHPYSILKLI